MCAFVTPPPEFKRGHFSFGQRGHYCFGLTLGVSYTTAWMMKHKLMQVMGERDDQKTLKGTIQLDDVYWGGERRGGKGGRGAPNKTPFVAAVEVNEEGQPIAMKFKVVDGFRSTEISDWANQHLAADTVVISDGLACFLAVAEVGCQHFPVVTGGGPDRVAMDTFTWVNPMIGNVKNAIHGTYHAIAHKHLPSYLAEFCYRFNRRFELKALLPRFLYGAVRTPPMPGRLLKLAEPH